MKTIKGSDVSTCLESCKRVYLCGKLSGKNGIEHIENSGYEIGISSYDKFTCESAHKHTYNEEYNYVLSGSIKVFIFDENKEYTFTTGDMYLIEPNMPYITKAEAGTRVLFTKTPGGNDKVLCPELEKAITTWTLSW